jgi:hypothetical protein
MQHLTSLAAATGGNRWQKGQRAALSNQAKTVVVRCDRLPRGRHDKEGSITTDFQTPPPGTGGRDSAFAAEAAQLSLETRA